MSSVRNAALCLSLLLVGCSSEIRPMDAGPDAPAPDAALPPDAAPPPDAGAFLGPEGAEASNALCSNGLDDDANTYTDCDDLWCRDSPAVTVCDALENTDARCSDGADNPERPGTSPTASPDGLTDCDDPDCSKGPAVTVCPPLRFERGDTDCANSADDDGDGLPDCADPDCSSAGTSVCGASPRQRVLFDDAHRERAGSADWVVDVAGPLPYPSAPRSERDWAGSLSSFGFDLASTGHFVVETLPALGARLSFRDASNPQDLSHYGVLVLPEPSAPLSASESDAVLAFVRAGGGLLLVADHEDSDRDGNGWDSYRVLNDLFARAGGGDLASNPFGFSVRDVGYSMSGLIENQNQREAATIPSEAATHPVLSGPHGAVTRLGMYRGGLFTLNPGAAGAQVTVLVHAMPLGTSGYVDGSPYVLAAQVGAGRVVAVGDSAILNDGTDSHGASDARFDSWHSATQQNAALFLNAVEWLSTPAPL